MKKLIILIILLISPICAFAGITSVSPLVHGNSATITGSSFGTKTIAAPIKYENFESGIANQLLSTGGYWQHRPSNTASFSNDVVRDSHSTLSAKQIQIGDEDQDWFYRNDVWSDSDEKGVVYFWFRSDITYPTTDTGGWQHKNWILTTDGSQYKGAANGNPLNIFTSTQYYDNGVADNNTKLANDLEVTQVILLGSRDYVRVSGKWQMITLIWQRSSLDQADGYIARYLTDPNGALTIAKEEKSAINTRNTSVNNNIKSIELGFFITNSSNQAEVITYYDDIYMDNSWARVEIGDNAVYDSCTHREIQIPTAWSDTSISATVNQGSFPDGSAYLFVVDESGAVSDGYPVTFTATATTCALEADKTVSVSPTTYTGTASTVSGQTITGVTSSNGFTVTPDDGVWDEQSETFTVSNVTAPITDTCTVTASDASTAQDSIIITLQADTDIPTNISNSGTSVTISSSGTVVDVIKEAFQDVLNHILKSILIILFGSLFIYILLSNKNRRTI